MLSQQIYSVQICGRFDLAVERDRSIIELFKLASCMTLCQRRWQSSLASQIFALDLNAIQLTGVFQAFIRAILNLSLGNNRDISS